MNVPFDFNYYLNEKIVRKQSPNIPRAEFLIKETQKSFIGLKNRVEKLGIDEFNAKTRVLNKGEEETITFVADKAGTFEYYCSVGQHRANGMVGKLIVE